VRARLLVGAFMADKTLFAPAAERLAQRFGPPDMASPWFSFHHTDYYAPEFGAPLFRRILSFPGLVEQDSLAEVKLFTNEVEKEFSRRGRRRVNLDPGILTAERFVLASGKNFTHRIYLSRGIFADLTLVYSKGRYRPLEWTYPDYREPDMLRFLLQARKKYLADLALCRDQQKTKDGTSP